MNNQAIEQIRAERILPVVVIEDADVAVDPEVEALVKGGSARVQR